MSANLRQMLADIARGKDARERGLRRELIRRMIETRKSRFVGTFTRQQRYYRAATDKGPKLSIDAACEAEAAHLAMDPGWDAERAWNYSETRQAAIDELEAEVARRLKLD